MTTTVPRPVSRRRMLALIALADDLPMPKTVKFMPANEVHDFDLLTLDFDTLDQAARWAVWFGTKTTSIDPIDNGALSFNHSEINWLGWQVRLHAWQQVPTEQPLDDRTRDRLEQVADLLARFEGGA